MTNVVTRKSTVEGIDVTKSAVWYVFCQFVLKLVHIHELQLFKKSVECYLDQSFKYRKVKLCVSYNKCHVDCM